MDVITVSELDKLIKNNTKPVIIDVREDNELIAAPFTSIKVTHIPLRNLVGEVNNLPDVPLYFLCHSGGRSALACQIAESAGHHKVFNIQGGILAWYQYIERLKH